MAQWLRRHMDVFSTVVFLALLAVLWGAVAGVGLRSLHFFGLREQKADVMTSKGPASKASQIQAPKPATKVKPPQPERRSSLPFVLRGTLVSQRPQWSLASIEDTRVRRVQSFMVGDKIEDGVVLSIHRSVVRLERAGGVEFIDLSLSGDSPTAAAVVTSPLPTSTRVASSPAGSGSLAPSLRQTHPGEWSVSSADVSAVMGNLMTLGTDARIIPSLKDGVASGFKLLNIRPGSLYERLGLQNGDVLRRVDGIELNSPESAFAAYSRLKDSPHIELELERGGSRVRQAYRVLQ